MPPSLADYQTAANSIYAPQQAAESTALKATHDTTVNSLEAQKGQVNTDYTSAVQQLTQSVQDQSAQINQLYSQRLGGNFSGLQGNDMGQMFSKANEQQGIITQTRNNKLGEITAGETNADINYNTDVTNLAPKYQSLESQYAQSAYGSAVKDYNTQQYQQAQLGLSYARLGQSANNSANAAATKYQVKQLSSGNKAYTGPNGQTNLFQYAMGSSGGDINAAFDTIKSELKTGSATDKGAYNGILKLESQGKSPQDILNSLQKSNSYIFN